MEKRVGKRAFLVTVPMIRRIAPPPHTRDPALPTEAQKLLEPGWSGPRPRGPSVLGVAACVAGQDDLGFMECGLIHKRKFL